MHLLIGCYELHDYMMRQERAFTTPQGVGGVKTLGRDTVSCMNRDWSYLGHHSVVKEWL